jgi:hypothetical protein
MVDGAACEYALQVRFNRRKEVAFAKAPLKMFVIAALKDFYFRRDVGHEYPTLLKVFPEGTGMNFPLLNRYRSH